MSRRAIVKYTDGPLIGVRHTHTWPKGHVSHFGSRFYPGSHAFILKFDYTGCMSFSDPFGIVSVVMTKQVDKVKTHLEHQTLKFWEHLAMTHMHASKVSSLIICTVPTYCTYLLPLPSVLYCTSLKLFWTIMTTFNHYLAMYLFLRSERDVSE